MDLWSKSTATLLRRCPKKCSWILGPLPRFVAQINKQRVLSRERERELALKHFGQSSHRAHQLPRLAKIDDELSYSKAKLAPALTERNVPTTDLISTQDQLA